MSTRRKHWTKTLRGKQILKRMAHERSLVLEAKTNGSDPLKEKVWFLFGSVSKEINYFAAAQGIPSATLAERVGKLLQSAG